MVINIRDFPSEREIERNSSKAYCILKDLYLNRNKDKKYIDECYVSNGTLFVRSKKTHSKQYLSTLDKDFNLLGTVVSVQSDCGQKWHFQLDLVDEAVYFCITKSELIGIGLPVDPKYCYYLFNIPGLGGAGPAPVPVPVDKDLNQLRINDEVLTIKFNDTIPKIPIDNQFNTKGISFNHNGPNQFWMFFAEEGSDQALVSVKFADVSYNLIDKDNNAYPDTVFSNFTWIQSERKMGFKIDTKPIEFLSVDDYLNNNTLPEGIGNFEAVEYPFEDTVTNSYKIDFVNDYNTDFPIQLIPSDIPIYGFVCGDLIQWTITSKKKIKYTETDLFFIPMFQYVYNNTKNDYDYIDNKKLITKQIDDNGNDVNIQTVDIEDFKEEYYPIRFFVNLSNSLPSTFPDTPIEGDYAILFNLQNRVRLYQRKTNNWVEIDYGDNQLFFGNMFEYFPAFGWRTPERISFYKIKRQTTRDIYTSLLGVEFDPDYFYLSDNSSNLGNMEFIVGFNPSNLDFLHAPSDEDDTIVWAVQNGTWIKIGDDDGIGIKDGPHDGKTYGRKDNAWVEVSGGGSVTGGEESVYIKYYNNTNSNKPAPSIGQLAVGDYCLNMYTDANGDKQIELSACSSVGGAPVWQGKNKDDKVVYINNDSYEFANSLWTKGNNHFLVYKLKTNVNDSKLLLDFTIGENTVNTYYVKFYNGVNQTLPSGTITLNPGDISLIINTSGYYDLWMYIDSTNGWTTINDFSIDDILFSDINSYSYDTTNGYIQGNQDTYNIFKIDNNGPALINLQIIKIPEGVKHYKISFINEIDTTKHSGLIGDYGFVINPNFSRTLVKQTGTSTWVDVDYTFDDLFYLDGGSYYRNGNQWSVRSDVDSELTGLVFRVEPNANNVIRVLDGHVSNKHNTNMYETMNSKISADASDWIDAIEKGMKTVFNVVI